MTRFEFVKSDRVKVIRNEQFYDACLWIFGSIRKNLDICTYKFELSNRADANGLNYLVRVLYSFAARHVRIRLLLHLAKCRSGLTRINEYAARQLKQHGIEVRSLPDDRCQHAKMILVDGHLGIIGSHNWSPKSLTENFEVSVLIAGKEHLASIQEHFDTIWEKSKVVK